jgi:chemotaxis protein methyltransferase CheR
MLMPFLQEHIVFAPHNLAFDANFGEMQIIFCRNVLTYFKQPLKNGALQLFDTVLTAGGCLCLGSKETLEGRAIAPPFAEILPRTRIYRKSFS